MTLVAWGPGVAWLALSTGRAFVTFDARISPFSSESWLSWLPRCPLLAWDSFLAWLPLRPPGTQEAREPWAAVFSFGSLLARASWGARLSR